MSRTPERSEGSVINSQVRRAGLALVVLSAGCSRACDGASQGDDASVSTQPVEAATPRLAPERCSPIADPVALGNDGGEVIGDIVTVGDDVYIASQRHGFASVGKTTLALGPPVWTDMGRTPSDAPPPELVRTGGNVFAFFWERAEAGSSRTLVVVRLPANERLWTLREDEAAESMAIDAAFSGPGGLVAWDGADGVRVAFLEPGKPVVPRDLSSTDRGTGSSAKVLSREEDGYVVVWAEHKVDTLPDGAPKTQPGENIETAGESRTFEWLNLLRMDLRGQPVGVPHRITSQTGHIGQVALASVKHDRFDIYARDGADALAEDVGGRILRFSVREDQVDSPVEVVGSGVGLGSPSVLPGSHGEAWLFFEDSLERTRAVPIGAPDPRPSLEHALDDVRLGVSLPDEGWLGVSAARSLVRVRCRAAPLASSEAKQ